MVLTLPCRFKDCTICLESLALHGPIAVTPCGHCLHKSCYDLWGAACTEQHRATTCPFCTQEVLEGQLFCFSFKNDPFLSGDAILPSTADLITTALTFPHASRDCGICLELLPRGGRPVAESFDVGPLHVSVPCRSRRPIFCYLFDTDPAENVENDDTDTGLPAILPCITSPTANVPKSCTICSAVASPDLQLLCCAQCQSAVYCSTARQKEDWMKEHKQICNLLNVGHGDRQVRTDDHTSRSIYFKERFERKERNLDENMKRFFKLFEDSTFGSWDAAQKMKKIAKRQSEYDQKFLLFHSLRFLIRSSDSEKLSWSNSPLAVMIQLVDSNVKLRFEETSETPLHCLAIQADPFAYSTHENQLILVEQLIEHGADVNAVLSPKGSTPLHIACHSGNVTNLDFVELLLEEGADPNVQDALGRTPLMRTTNYAPGAAKFLLNWPTTDANITTRVGASFLAMVRLAITDFRRECTP